MISINQHTMKADDLQALRNEILQNPPIARIRGRIQKGEFPISIQNSENSLLALSIPFLLTEAKRSA